MAGDEHGVRYVASVPGLLNAGVRRPGNEAMRYEGPIHIGYKPRTLNFMNLVSGFLW